MNKYEIYNLATGTVVATAVEDDPKLRPIVPDACGIRLAIPAASPEPDAAQAVAPPDPSPSAFEFQSGGI